MEGMEDFDFSIKMDGPDTTMTSENLEEAGESQALNF